MMSQTLRLTHQLKQSLTEGILFLDFTDDIEGMGQEKKLFFEYKKK